MVAAAGIFHEELDIIHLLLKDSGSVGCGFLVVCSHIEIIAHESISKLVAV